MLKHVRGVSCCKQDCLPDQILGFITNSSLQSEALDPQLTVTDTMVEAAPDAKINDIKALLGRMMFSGKSMEKSVRNLPDEGKLSGSSNRSF